jgi:hypothetical protein
MPFLTSHPSPLPPPIHLPTTWTHSSHPVLRFARFLHPTRLPLQVLRSLSPHHTQPRCPGPHHVGPGARAPRSPGVPAHATRGLDVFVRAMRGLGLTLHRAPPWCISDDIWPPRRCPLALGHWSTTLSSWLVTPQHPPDGHLSCCRGHQARGSSTTLRRRRSPDTISGPDLCL